MIKKIKNWFQPRKNKYIATAVIITLVLCGRLFMLTTVQHEKWSNAAKNVSIKGIYTPSPRGSIYDRNGELLAGSKQIFTVKMNLGTYSNREINRSAYNLIKIFEKNGDRYERNLPISVRNGKYYFTFDKEEKKWLKDQGLNPNIPAEEAFEALRKKLGIPQGDRYDVQKEMQQKYNIFPPISVRTMKYNSEQEKKEFLEGNGIVENADEEDITAGEAFRKLRENLEIDEQYSALTARKILNVRYELSQMGYRKYMPATVARDVTDNTVVYIEENSDKLKGVSVVPETKRFYPRGSMASHILGYIGKISSEEVQKYEDIGYSPDAFIGKEGIERAFESTLKGRDGTTTIAVDNKGNYVKTLDKIEPKKGKDIYLTIDSNLQEIAEDALRRNINAVRGGGAFASEFGSLGTAMIAPKAQTGAIVALDIETGDVLALASYPDFDPNIFVDGIEPDAWEDLQSKNPRNTLEPAPLFNIATLSALQPGSTFKPVTALAALDCGLNPNRTVYDDGFIQIGNRTFGCFLWNTNKRKHGFLNMYRAIEVSCNYYFYDIATNKDWNSGASMGMDKSMGVDKITQTAEQLGLGKPTGIEIPETVVPVPTKERKISGLKRNLENELYANAERFFKAEVYSNSKRLQHNVETISSWITEKGITPDEMYNDRLPKVGVKKSQYERVTNLCLYTYFNQADWSVGDAFNISIGQGENAYTPLQMANAMATIANKGKHNQASVIDIIEDEGERVAGKSEKMNIKNDVYFDQVLEGMRRVAISPGSGVGKHYIGFPWTVCAKTGTAQKSGKINPKSEVDYIKSHLSAFGNMSWKSVKKEMNRLMETYPDIYTTEDVAVRRAVINLSGNKVTSERLDSFKPSYDEFAWVVAIAPMDDPKIAVASVIPQGVTGGNANPMVREVIGQYMKSIDKDYKDKNKKEEEEIEEKEEFTLEPRFN